MKYLICFAVLLCAVISCVPPGASVKDAVVIDYSIDDQRMIRDLEIERNTTGLLPYLQGEEASSRALAALALSSVQDSAAIDALAERLKMDPSAEVRQYCAYALGQTYHPDALQHLIEAFGMQDTAQINSAVRGAILESVGKVGNTDNLRQISTVSTYRDSDHFLLLGQARAIFRFGLRNILSPEGTKKMVDLVVNPDVNPDARILAANYFRRFGSAVAIDSFSSVLLSAYESSDLPEVQMALATVLAGSNDSKIVSALFNRLNPKTDYRITYNALAGLGATGYSLFADSLSALLTSPNPHIPARVAQTIALRAPVSTRVNLLNQARQINHPQTQAILYGASLQRTSKNFINTRAIVRNEILQQLDSTNSVYDRQYFIRALAQDPENIPLLMTRAGDIQDVVEQSMIAQTIAASMNTPAFLSYYNSAFSLGQVRESILTYVISVLNSKNSGAIAAISPIIRDEQNGFKERVELRRIIRNAVRNLKLPEELETKMELERSLAFIEERDFVSESTKSRPIDWQIIERCTDSTLAVIMTTKGRIEVELYAGMAPASVANFIKLGESQYFDGKYFHRVVPNFVIQGGCPRGDGYGSLDYTINSELGPLNYDSEGYVGMASAGKDTEGVQWFVTHSPTPHLDGKYSIFGKVIRGMNVVHAITPGDKINQVTILNQRFL